MTGQIILQLILIALTALFTCAEISVISLSDSKLEKLAAGGSKNAKRLKKLTDKPDRFLSAIRTAVTLSGFLGAAFAARSFSRPLTDLIMGSGLNIP